MTNEIEKLTKEVEEHQAAVVAIGSLLMTVKDYLSKSNNVDGVLLAKLIDDTLASPVIEQSLSARDQLHDRIKALEGYMDVSDYANFAEAIKAEIVWLRDKGEKHANYSIHDWIAVLYNVLAKFTTAVTNGKQDINQQLQSLVVLATLSWLVHSMIADSMRDQVLSS